MYNITILSLYYLCISTFHNVVEVESDVLTNLNVLERNLWGRIDASIRHHIRKPGISITKNIYLGFDTEFNRVESGKNKLISSQITVSSRVFVKIPKTPRYTISSFDVDQNKLYRLKTKSNVFNYTKVETSIQ